MSLKSSLRWQNIFGSVTHNNADVDKTVIASPRVKARDTDSEILKHHKLMNSNKYTYMSNVAGVHAIKNGMSTRRTRPASVEFTA